MLPVSPGQASSVPFALGVTSGDAQANLEPDSGIACFLAVVLGLKDTGRRGSLATPVRCCVRMEKSLRLTSHLDHLEVTDVMHTLR